MQKSGHVPAVHLALRQDVLVTVVEFRADELSTRQLHWCGLLSWRGALVVQEFAQCMKHSQPEILRKLA